MLLRQVREQLADWETGLTETARDAGAGWADLAHPLGAAGRQAAERTTATCARPNAAALRRPAGQITDLPATARRPLDRLHAALAHDDPADLLAPKARHHRVLGDIPWPHTDTEAAIAAFEASRTEAEQHGPMARTWFRPDRNTCTHA